MAYEQWAYIVRRFTKRLPGYFETDNLCLFNNGTLALFQDLKYMTKILKNKLEKYKPVSTRGQRQT